MSTTLYPAAPEMSRDEAAEILQKRKIHHAVVQNVSGKFAGLLSSWDIARECSLDAKVINVRDVQWVTHKRCVIRENTRFLPLAGKNLTFAPSRPKGVSVLARHDVLTPRRDPQAWPYNRSVWSRYDGAPKNGA